MGKLTLLGTGTCDPSPERAGAGVLIELAQDQLVLFDCGRAVAQRLFELGLKSDHIQHIIISHYHPDHWQDLISILQSGSWGHLYSRRRELHLYGPRGLAQRVGCLLKVFDEKALLNGNFALEMHEHDGRNIEIWGQIFECLPLPHVENHGLRFVLNGRRIALTGDSPCCAEETAFLKDADLAVIDAGHPSDDEIVKLAVEAQDLAALKEQVCRSA